MQAPNQIQMESESIISILQTRFGNLLTRFGVVQNILIFWTKHLHCVIETIVSELKLCSNTQKLQFQRTINNLELFQALYGPTG